MVKLILYGVRFNWCHSSVDFGTDRIFRFMRWDLNLGNRCIQTWNWKICLMALAEFSEILCDVIMMTCIQLFCNHSYQDELALFISCQPKTIGIILKCAVKANRQLRSSSARRSLDRCNQTWNWKMFLVSSIQLSLINLVQWNHDHSYNHFVTILNQDELAFFTISCQSKLELLQNVL